MREKKFIKSIMLLFSFTICFFLSVGMVHAKEQKKLLVEYYFYNSCDGCTEGEYFENELKEKLEDVVSDKEYDFVLKDVSQPKFYDEFVELTKDRITDDFHPAPPLLKIGDVFLFGMDDISEHSRDTIIEETKGGTQSQETLIESMKGIEANDSFFVYFHVPGCTDCEKAQKYFETMNKTVYMEDQTESNIKMVYINLGDFENVPLAKWFYEKYEVDEKDQKAPALFYANGYLQGFEDIKDGLPRVVDNGEAMNWQDINYSQSSEFTIGDWGMLLLTGLANGLNPCGLSILLLLVSLLLEKREKVWKLGAAFIGAKIVTYLLLGTIFSSVIGQLSTYIIGPAQKILKVILAMVFLTFAILNFIDVYLARKEKYGTLKMQLPARLKKFNNDYLKKKISGESKSTIVLIFLAGIVVSAGEFLCTGQLYLASILYVMQRYNAINWSVFLMFLVYVICMCLPLIVITLIANGSAKLIHISEAVRKKMPLIKLIYGILFIIFAVLIFIL